MLRAVAIAGLAIMLGSPLGAEVSGPVRHYDRTNSDGSERERVVVYAPQPAEVRVFKGRAKCTDAAYVTAGLDPATGQALGLVGGRLTRALHQNAQGWLRRDPDGRLAARFERARTEPDLAVPTDARWVLYDFDFADLIAHPPPEILQRKPVRFDLPLFLNSDPPEFRNRGQMVLSYVKEERHGGRRALLYRASGPALGDKTGSLWFDATDGRLIEARLPVPNHAEYRDFRLKLVKAEAGESAWLKTLRNHWKGCPAEE